MERELLIVGLDPGTTLAYALMDVYGNILKVKSTKQVSMNILPMEISKYGRPIVVASDVTPAPNKVRKFATAFGAKLISPEENMTIKEKNYMTKEYKLDNKHEKDALASALFAHSQIRELLKKIDMKSNPTETNVSEIKRLLLTENTWNISRASQAARI